MCNEDYKFEMSKIVHGVDFGPLSNHKMSYCVGLTRGKAFGTELFLVTAHF